MGKVKGKKIKVKPL